MHADARVPTSRRGRGRHSPVIIPAGWEPGSPAITSPVLSACKAQGQKAAVATLAAAAAASWPLAGSPRCSCSPCWLAPIHAGLPTGCALHPGQPTCRQDLWPAHIQGWACRTAPAPPLQRLHARLARRPQLLCSALPAAARCSHAPPAPAATPPPGARPSPGRAPSTPPGARGQSGAGQTR